MIPNKVMQHLKKGGAATHRDAPSFQIIHIKKGKLIWHDGFPVKLSNKIDNDWIIKKIK